MQQLLLNMRKVDYMGSKALASTLMFAAPQRQGGSEDSDCSFETEEIGQRDPSLRGFANDMQLQDRRDV